MTYMIIAANLLFNIVVAMVLDQFSFESVDQVKRFRPSWFHKLVRNL